LTTGDGQPIPTNNEQRSTGLSSLKKIREQVTKQNNKGIISKELTEAELYIAWESFIEKLREKNNHSAITNFKAAQLKVIDNNSIEIVTQGEIHKAFIEVERANLILHLQTHFNNRLLVYQIQVEENPNDAAVTDAPLSRKQQYLKIIEEYPLVQELRERLKLELE
jgi:DNA polymerase-3 subunit gamma/tau